MADDKLARYKAKRDFSVTSEPGDDDAPDGDQLGFVIQKHWASRLHYDFRLELDGTMKSWAVPKGPSYDPTDKRMAVHVEDHPVSYSSFEGTIPAKQYGAGKVIIWDKGLWVPIGDPHQGYKDGHLKFELIGLKMRGKWALIRIQRPKGRQDAWLLIKEKDAFVKSASEFSVVDAFPDSVQGMALPTREGGTPEASRAPTRGRKRAAASAGPHPDAVKARLPAKLSPQLATLVDAPPPQHDTWIWESKFDGYRLLSRIDGGDVQLFTRNGNDWTARLKPLHAAIQKLKLPAGWYDGEIVVMDANGIPSFGALQNAFDTAATKDIVYFLFDVPYLNGFDLRGVPLEVRRQYLATVLGAGADTVRFSEAFDASPASLVKSACQLGLEGLIGKRKDSRYASSRSAAWIKLKCSHRQEFVIGGWTDPKGGRSGLGALILGVHDENGQLIHAGNVGTGFNQETLHEIRSQLDQVPATRSPFAGKVAMAGRPHWVKPTMVAEVTFAEWTRDNHIRHAVFHGLRTDKPAKSIVREKAVSVPAKGKTPAPSAKTAKAAKADSTASHALSTRLRITHGDRVIDTSTGTTKIELVRYYALVGDLMMAHLKGRPISLVRAPTGVGGQLFFQKHAEVEKMPGIRQLDPALYASHPPMLEVASKVGLVSAAQWNMVEIHTLNTSTTSFEHADRIVFDLDPGKGVQWKAIQEGARVLHVFLEQLGLPAFLKTSGGKGLHVVVPIRKAHDWDTVKGFSQAVVTHLARTLPHMFVAKSGPKNRVGKIFIDYLRNGLGATTVCAWSARARPGLGISVPVDWSELPRLRGGDHWTVGNVHTRLDAGNDPWAGYARAARSITSAMKKLGFEA
ncbi:DNA ligase D [Variovorax ginsengisoli]|uniref:DNA ligase (ATP) n=1 Tax=Variovorax ginsengisoli TaxID=363844 RepID=A0ABT9SAE8_9BURK|nr:DNA ligase D [Variovorax ginsengisoli]MDP9900813.1 bifunctional non-homologous end joining protein LigD [Variovorax ginsengisoli]